MHVVAHPKSYLVLLLSLIPKFGTAYTSHRSLASLTAKVSHKAIQTTKVPGWFKTSRQSILAASTFISHRLQPSGGKKLSTQ